MGSSYTSKDPFFLPDNSLADNIFMSVLAIASGLLLFFVVLAVVLRCIRALKERINKVPRELRGEDVERRAANRNYRTRGMFATSAHNGVQVEQRPWLVEVLMRDSETD